MGDGRLRAAFDGKVERVLDETVKVARKGRQLTIAP
jgi:hypothetical protein